MKGLESNRIFTSVEGGAHEGDGTGTGDRVIPWQYDAGLARGREGGFSMTGNRMEFGLRAWNFKFDAVRLSLSLDLEKLEKIMHQISISGT
jgi:hypothetical protein